MGNNMDEILDLVLEQIKNYPKESINKIKSVSKVYFC